jgi:S-adenosylhomocysteine hydrolase
MPPAIDAEVAGLTLASLGMKIDILTAAQLRYLESWRTGS